MEIDTLIQVQFLDGAIFIYIYSINTTEKSMHPIILPPDMSK